MNHNEARKIISESGSEVVLDEENGTVIINGEMTIEELQAVLQLLEYSA
jgi:flagellar basal body P-ring protein FlgI